MKAIIYTEYGPPEVLHLAEVTTPTPQENEILIRVHAVSVNFGDLIARNFGNVTAREFNMPSILYYPARLAFGWNKPKNPILGSEFAGEVAAVGAAVGVKVGWGVGVGVDSSPPHAAKANSAPIMMMSTWDLSIGPSLPLGNCVTGL